MIVVFATFIGAAMGSFACCQAWRIRLKEEEKKDPGKRSVCMSCGKKLRWYENVPIVSWLLQGGKCRKCGARIGRAEILAEALGALSFGLIAWKFVGAVPVGMVGPAEFLAEFDLARLVAVLAAMVGMLILAVYDGKWGELPVRILLYTIIMGFVYVIITVYQESFGLISACPEGATCIQGGTLGFSFDLFLKNLLPVLGSVALLAGTYYLLYFFSKEKLVGGGDWLLCLAIGLILGRWELALVELFLANFLGGLVMLPAKKKRIAFGPFLVVAFVMIFAFSDALLATLAMNL